MPNGGETKPPNELENPPAVPDLSGEWKTQADEGGSYMGAHINGETIEVYWVIPSEDMTALYWSGSFTAPPTADEPYSWTSQANSEKNSSALLASTDEAKEFTYAGQKITCSVTALGATKEMAFEKGEWGYSKVATDSLS